MMKRTIIDRVVEYFSPHSAARRYHARFQLDEFESFLSKRRFDAASQGRRTEGWRTASTDANAAYQGFLQRMRDRSRDLVRNNPYASRAVQVISTNVVGKGIKGEVVGRNTTQQRRVSEAWERWAETKECDFDGKNTFYGLQRLAFRTVVESGAVLIRKRRVQSYKSMTVPLKLQLLEPDFIDTAKQGVSGSNYIVQGCEFNASHKLVAYYLFDEHPGNASGMKSIKSRRVPASEVDYMYRVDRIGQIHGIPAGVSVFIRLKDFDDYEDAQLVRQKIAACFTAFVYDSSGAGAPTGLDKQRQDDTDLVDKFEPGAIEILPPGRDVRLANPPTVQNYGEYTSTLLHSIASGFDVPYEAITGDYSQVNYSSSRMTWLQFGRDIDDWQNNMLIPQMCGTSFDWFLHALSLMGIASEGARMKWITPQRELIDPTKEIPAKIKAIRGGLTSQRRALREMGHNPEEIYSEIEKDNELLDEKKIILDTDPRKMTAGGTIQKEEDDNNAEQVKQDD